MLSGYHAIPNLLGRYAEYIDGGDYAALGELFAHASITSGEDHVLCTGADEARAMYERMTRRYEDDGTPHTRHVTTNPILDVDDEAGAGTCRSYVTVFQATAALPLQPIFAGRYHDWFERADGVWRFTRRHMITDRVGDLSQHLLRGI